MNLSEPTLDEIKEVYKRIKPFIRKTPIFTSATLDEMFGAKFYFKCENFQKVGAFKFRGAVNSVLSLSESERRKGVATHSSGNHAAALSLAAKMNGISARIVMPKNSPQIKINAVKNYGGIITFCEPNLKSREDTLKKIVEETGATEIHPYNNYSVIAGQATCAMEFLEEVNALDLIVVPVGGGGLLSGTLLTVKSISPSTKVIAAEPEGADDAFRSLKENRIVPSVNPNTIADGLRTSLGDKTFPIIKRLVDEIVTVKEESIINAMRFIWERMKIIVEPSSAVPLAAVSQNKVCVDKKRVGIILSGGNVDLDFLPWK